MKKLISIIITAALLTACQQVPQNVKDRTQELESKQEVQSSQPESDPSIEPKTDTAEQSDTGDLDYIRSRLKEDAGKKYGTITVKHASAGESKSMPTYKVEVGGNPNCDIKQLGKAFFGEDYETKGKCDYITVDAEKLPDAPEKSSDPHVDLLEEQDQYLYKCANLYTYYSLMIDQGKKGEDPPDTFRSLGISDGGSVGGRQTTWKKQGEFYDKYYNKTTGSQSTSVKEYYPMLDKLPDDSFKMTDGSDWSVKDAVKFAEDTANKTMTLNDPAI